MSLLTAAQLASIRDLGKLGMTVTVTIRRFLGLPNIGSYDDDDYPTGIEVNETASYEVTGTQVQGWLVSNMGRTFDEDGDRIVAVHDFTLRVPVGTVIDSRDLAVIAGATYTVMETNTEDTWPEWTECYLKKVN